MSFNENLCVSLGNKGLRSKTKMSQNPGTSATERKDLYKVAENQEDGKTLVISSQFIGCFRVPSDSTIPVLPNIL